MECETWDQSNTEMEDGVNTSKRHRVRYSREFAVDLKCQGKFREMEAMWTEVWFRNCL
jgi:hypothetical protein